MRAKTANNRSSDGLAGRALIGRKVRMAMARMMAAAKHPRASAAGTAPPHGRIKAALSPSRWRAGARRWWPSAIRAGGAVVLPDSAASRAAVEAEAKIVAEALLRLAPAMFRAALYGLPVSVKAPDARTADVFRAALLHNAAERPTNRLVKVVVGI